MAQNYLIIDVDIQKASSVGLSADEVAFQAVTALNSGASSDRQFWIDTQAGNQYLIAAQDAEILVMKLGDLVNIEVMGNTQTECKGER